LAALLPSLKVLSKQLEAEIKAGKIQVSMEARGLVISFRQAALFRSGEATLIPEAREPVAKIAAAMKEIPNPARLEGHTDSIPIHTEQFQSNWELSAARSIALLRLLTEEFAVPGEKLSIAGYADNSPVESNDTEEGRQRNRRVDIVILNETGVSAEPSRTPASAQAAPPVPSSPAQKPSPAPTGRSPG
jgi:chemotaxis protein MotB